MVFITEDMIRKRAEHNECIISTLEEISLHQQDIERIEHLDKWCRDLKILYLQSNLIPKIEHVGRLKKLEYINLALNNVERIENLEGCESLKKLDLTVNFVGELTSIESLRSLYNLRELYLTGNPCTEYVHYREYVIATLPQLQKLDGLEVEKSERIQATQILHQTRPSIIQQQAHYRRKRQRQKEEELLRQMGQKTKDRSGTDWYTDLQPSPKIVELGSDEEEDFKTDEQKDKEFWEEKVPFTPESRVAVHNHMKELKQKDDAKEAEKKPKKPPRKLISDEGRAYNVNEPGVDFSITEDFDNQSLLLDVSVYKHMDSSLLDIDVQPTYVRVTLKGKVLQLVLPEEVKPDSSTAKRSQTTGHLLITMPTVNQILAPQKMNKMKGDHEKENKPTTKSDSQQIKHERLEVDPSQSSVPDICGIVSDKSKSVVPPLGSRPIHQIEERPNSEDFVDDPDVPPLI